MILAVYRLRLPTSLLKSLISFVRIFSDLSVESPESHSISDEKEGAEGV